MKLEIKTFNRLETKPELRAIVDTLLEHKEIRPEKFACGEPVRTTFDEGQYRNRFDEWFSHISVIETWQSFNWKNRVGRLQGGVSTAPRRHKYRTHGSIWVDYSNPAATGVVSQFVERLCSKFEVHYGCIHQSVPQEGRFGIEHYCEQSSDEKTGKVITITPAYNLQDWLRNLYWVNIFGRPYLELFGKERLLSAPAYEVRELDGGAVWLQLTPDAMDIERDYDGFEAVRSRVKRHLAKDVFFRADYPISHLYETPEFGLGDRPFWMPADRLLLQESDLMTHQSAQGERPASEPAAKYGAAPIALEKQLADLVAIGIANSADVTIDDLLDERDREHYETRPYDVILSVLGTKSESKNQNDACTLCDCIWEFDTECIVDRGDYVRLAKRLCVMAGHPDLMMDMRDSVDIEIGKAWIRYTIPGAVRKWQIKVNNDWVDVETLAKMMRDIEQTANDGRHFYARESDDQSLLLLYLTNPAAEQLNQYCGGKIRQVLDD